MLSRPEAGAVWILQYSDVRLDGGVVEGARFTWRNGRTRLASRFAVVDANRELTWTGAALGAKVVHRHVMTPTDNGMTRLYSEESMAGPFLVLLFSSAKLRAALEHWLTAIKIGGRVMTPLNVFRWSNLLLAFRPRGRSPRRPRVHRGTAR